MIVSIGCELRVKKHTTRRIVKPIVQSTSLFFFSFIIFLLFQCSFCLYSQFLSFCFSKSMSFVYAELSRRAGEFFFFNFWLGSVFGAWESIFSVLDSPGFVFVGVDPDDAGIFPVGIVPVRDPDPSPFPDPVIPEPGDFLDFDFFVEDKGTKFFILLQGCRSLRGLHGC